MLILPVYFAQNTAVRLDPFSDQARLILDFSGGGLFFSYDLPGYGMMALSTFFTGLTLKPKSRADKWFRTLMLIQGVFFFSCFIMPMTVIFSFMADGENGMGGTIALEFRYAYFTPIGILSIPHFSEQAQQTHCCKYFYPHAKRTALPSFLFQV